MNIAIAKAIIKNQNKELKKLNDKRFIDGRYEYRLTYNGGFACYYSVDRREVGKRNFKDFGFVDVTSCGSSEKALELVLAYVRNKNKKRAV